MPERVFDGYDQNVYFHPEACGLTMVGDLDDENACYSYDTLIVVRDVETGDLYATHDSGCSCPHPFAEVRSLSDMNPIHSLEEFKAFVKAHGDYHGWPSEQRQALYREVRKALVS